MTKAKLAERIDAIRTMQRLLKWTNVKLNNFIMHTTGEKCLNDLKGIDVSMVVIGLREKLPNNLTNKNIS